MNEVIKNITTRYSCRAFKDEIIPKEALAEIMSAAVSAPTARNTQDWKFTVLTNRELIQKLAAVMGKALDNDSYDMYNPQVLVIPSTPADLDYGVDNNACALENIFLAAHSLGIGSCWINQMQRVGDDPEVVKVLREFGIPEGHVVYGMAALGYPAKEHTNPVKRTGEVVFLK